MIDLQVLAPLHDLMQQSTEACQAILSELRSIGDEVGNLGKETERCEQASWDAQTASHASHASLCKTSATSGPTQSAGVGRAYLRGHGTPSMAPPCCVSVGRWSWATREHRCFGLRKGTHPASQTTPHASIYEHVGFKQAFMSQFLIQRRPVGVGSIREPPGRSVRITECVSGTAKGVWHGQGPWS